MSAAEPKPEKLAEGSLISHLLELRNRLLRAALGVAVLAVPCIIFADEIFTFVAQPLIDKLPAGGSMIATNVIAPFMTPLKLAIVAAIFLAMPFVLYQLWAFIAPGLYRKEKRFALPLLISSILLFYAGVAFAYFLVFPVAFAFFSSTAPDNVLMMTDINNYLDFVLVIFFAFGAAFEIPVATILLIVTGMVKLEALTRNRGYVLLGISIVAAIITPPDAISMLIMTIPMYLLYEGGILMARLMLRAKGKEAAEEAAG